MEGLQTTLAKFHAQQQHAVLGARQTSRQKDLQTVIFLVSPLYKALEQECQILMLTWSWSAAWPYTYGFSGTGLQAVCNMALGCLRFCDKRGRLNPEPCSHVKTSN